MKITKELRSLSSEELVNRLSESRKELLKLNVQQATGTVNNPGKISVTKKTIARINTLLNQNKSSGVKLK